MSEKAEKNVSEGELVCETGRGIALWKKKKRSKGLLAFEIIICLVISSPFLLILFAILSVVIGDPIVFHAADRRKLADWESGEYLMTESVYLGKCASYIIPSFSECSGYSSASFYWNDNEYGFDWSDYCMYAVCLDLSFEEESYAAAKEQALASHHFLEAPVETSYSDYYMPVAQTMIGGYDVRIVDENPHEWGVNEDEYLTWFPISFGFVAFQDENMTIRYCYIYNSYFSSFSGAEGFSNYIKLNFPVDWE